MNAVPIDDVIRGDCWRFTILPPGDVVLGYCLPGDMVLTVYVIAHSITSQDSVIGCGLDPARQLAEIVRFAKVVPGNDFDDIRREVSRDYGLEALRKEVVGVLDPSVRATTIVKVFVLPGRDGCRGISNWNEW